MTLISERDTYGSGRAKQQKPHSAQRPIRFPPPQGCQPPRARQSASARSKHTGIPRAALRLEIRFNAGADCVFYQV